ncbi:MAG: PrgI family protein [Candidatus Taylorbacteria bacterium]|nr:PrgI family protein [Candidatus Taylorbacteria bacterium]
MNFQVPQFIEVEDKIFGPFTLKQFVYIAGGAGLSFIIYRVIPYTMLAIPIILVVVAFVLALSFYKVNNKPFINMVESAFTYAIHKKLYLWKKTELTAKELGKKTNAEMKEDASALTRLSVPKLSESKLKDLAWSLDIHESIYSNKNQR